MNNIHETIRKVRQWGRDKGITGPNGKGTLLGQLSKTQEELTEARDAAIRWEHYGPGTGGFEKLHEEIKDGIGDTIITLILAAEMAGLTIEDCLAFAYSEIANRKGKMVNGQFVKKKQL